jgi:hypothetical protein
VLSIKTFSEMKLPGWIFSFVFFVRCSVREIRCLFFQIAQQNKNLKSKFVVSKRNSNSEDCLENTFYLFKSSQTFKNFLTNLENVFWQKTEEYLFVFPYSQRLYKFI